MSSPSVKCSICQKPLGKDNKKEVTTSCKHTFHRKCAEQQVINSRSNNCPNCNKKSALKYALTDDPVATDKQHHSVQSKSTKNDEKASHVASAVKNKLHLNNADEDEWECVSSVSKSVPKMYPEPDDDNYSSFESGYDREPRPKIASRSTSSKMDNAPLEAAHTSDIKLKSSKEKTQPPTSFTSLSVKYQVPVYISDLPLDIEDDHQLANDIRHRVEKTLQIEPGDIKCYSKLGVGVMYVSSQQIKDHLIDHVRRFMLHPKKEQHIISFLHTLELVSYIVVDVPKEKIDLPSPRAEEISHRWTELHKGEKPMACEQLNIQFPNIYRLVSASLEQLLNSLDHQDFKIKNYFAHIYFCADCSFLEDLPRSITYDQLQTTISQAIKQSHIPSSSLYIQMNKKTGDACIIAADAARKWTAISYIYLGDKPISKKDNLTCRLLVHPVPETLSIQTIINHSDFAGKITNYKQNGENLILEISDKSVFDDCIKRGAIRIAKKHMLHMDPYTAANNPDGSEINGDIWYDTEMGKYKPDVMQFFANPQHPIFRFKYQSDVGEKPEGFSSSPTGTSPFYNACRENNINLVEYYLQTMSVEKINQVEPNGSTALHVASYRGYEKIVELLLEKGASHSIINKYNLTPFDEAKTDKIKQMIRRRMDKTRFVSDTIEWIISTNDADFQAHQYLQKLETYGKDPHFYQLIVYIKQNYIEKDLKDVENINKIKQYFDTAIKEKDPVYLLTAYTAETGFYSTLNIHLAKLQLENLTDSENLSRAYYIGIVARHPMLETFSYTGKVFRGMIINNDDLKKYKIGTKILTKTFSSSSKELNIALRFLRENSDIGDRLRTICTYEIRNQRTALDIEHISLFQYEKEVLILPYSAFKIIDIQKNKDNSPNVEIKLKECDPW